MAKRRILLETTLYKWGLTQEQMAEREAEATAGGISIKWLPGKPPSADSTAKRFF